MKYLLTERSTAYQQVFLAWLGVAVMLSAHGAPREVDVRETRALCQDPTVAERFRPAGVIRVQVYGLGVASSLGGTRRLPPSASELLKCQLPPTTHYQR